MSKLHFQEDEAKPSKLSHKSEGLSETALLTTARSRAQQDEDDNAGLDAAHLAENAAEDGSRAVQSARRSLHSRRSRRKGQEGQETSGSYSKWQQRQRRKQAYAARAGSSGQAAAGTAAAGTEAAQEVKGTAKIAEKIGAFAASHSKALVVLGVVILLLILLLNVASSCSVLLDGGLNAIGISTYPSADEDMLAAESQYCAMESELQSTLDSYERTHDYDEYHYDLDDIGHDPYVLISGLTALMGGGWTIDQVQDQLDRFFGLQYELTEEVTTETRYRTETKTGYRYVYDEETGERLVDEETGEYIREKYRYKVRVPYTYYICNVTLTNNDLSHIPASIMTEDQLSMYAMYMATLGNRSDLFGYSEYVAKYTKPYASYDIPEEALEDEVFAAMMEEAQKYLGYPYVYGGSSPATSFDCSGFVCWVLNNCGQGWNVGRTTAQGLSNYCTLFTNAASARPGDLVFFQGTYDFYETITHVGIYVGNGMILHCGDPIQFTSIETAWWQEHFYAFGRLS